MFANPGHELDFAIYGEANTNKLQLSPTQAGQLQAQQHQVSLCAGASEGPDLTGYHSGLFEVSPARRLSRHSKLKTNGSITFADQAILSRHSSQKHRVRQFTSSSEVGLSDQVSMNHERKLSRNRIGDAIRVNTSASTLRPIHAQPPGASDSQASQPALCHDDNVRKSREQTTFSCSHSAKQKWQSCPSFVVTPVEDQESGFYDENDTTANGHSKTKITSGSKNDSFGRPDKREMNTARPSYDDTIQSLAVDHPVVSLRSLVARSTSVISTASSNGRPRLTHRLSYLASVNLEAEKEMDHARLSSLGKFAGKEEQPLRPSSAKSLNEFDAPRSASALQRHDPVHEGANLKQPPSPLPLPRSTEQHSHGHLVHEDDRYHHHHHHQQQQTSSLQNSNGSAPPIPKLYKRLLRVFNPPSDSSDSDTAMAVHSNASQDAIFGRGPHGLPPTPESVGFNTRRIMAGIEPSKSPPVSSRRRPLIPPIPPAPVTIKEIANSKPAEPHLGFRARFLKKLMSSPNLNVNSSVAPMGRVAPGLSHMSEKDYSYGYENENHPSHASSFSPFLYDFEHEHSCPVGQRIKEYLENTRKRAETLPQRQPAPMPTLQSKYGVPGRELGAGTQAQVMLLRVRSSKRIRASLPPPRKKAHATPSSTPSSTERVPSPRQLSPNDDALLSPRDPSGTLTTTLEEDVTPEQREAYRKKLLRRTSTGAMSMSSTGGLIYAIKKFRPPRASETHRQYLKKVCAEFCISTSMDHENIIRTIDLVRDQPGQEIGDESQDEEEAMSKKATLASSGYSRQCYPEKSSSRGKSYDKSPGNHQNDIRGYVNGGNSLVHEEGEWPSNSNVFLDCNCSGVQRSSSGRVRTVRSAGELRGQSRNPQYRISVVRRTGVAMPQRKRSTDAYSTCSSGNGLNGPRRASEPSQGSNQPPVGPSRSAQPHQRYSSEHDAKKRRQHQQQIEQEARHREVQRLKQQRKDEKNQAKQLGFDQFPEYCMVMEFAAGGDLFNLLTKSYPPISLHEKHCLWRQLLNGVQYMHNMGVAHRDLKPENILIDVSGKILKITDFGIANVFKSVGDPNPLPCRGIIGSEPYIAPEEFHQDEYDPRAVDVWACGIIFYVMYYAAMPWARADRKKDGRYARFFNDIMIHRQAERQRRAQYERQLQQSLPSSTHSQRYGGTKDSAHCSRKISSPDLSSSPHQPSHHRHFPPFNPDAGALLRNHQDSTDSSLAGSPSSQHSHGSTETGQSSVQGSPIESTMAPHKMYNTYEYNHHLGGHEFIDQMGTPGCRRVMYAILEPEPRRRLSINQVVNDEWVQRIRHCTDDIEKQEQQASVHLGKEAHYSMYMMTATTKGEPHHKHAVPKKVRH
ncbi:serine/threonine-protein kinase HAL4/sat4 [Podila humilis]|nr:serine/threonine-protein kinase HAL4/sat4 [Podila humilis]